jgi:hypothetical protein
MPRPSKLTPDQWREIERRLNVGDSASELEPLELPSHVINVMAGHFATGRIPSAYYEIPTTSLGFVGAIYEMAIGGNSDFADFFEYMRKKQAATGWSFVYVVKGTHNGKTVYKIGKANDVANRVKLFAVKIPFDIKPILAFYVRDAYKIEGDLHKAMKKANVGGEWFSLSESQLDNVFMRAASQELLDHSAMIEVCMAEIADSDKMNDSDYIEYLESILAINGLTFSRKRKP